VSIGKVQNFPKEGRDKKKRVELGEWNGSGGVEKFEIWFEKR